jgi:hypothetical protein
MKEAFIKKSFRNGTMAVIDQANGIIAQLQRQGCTLTLRQLYHQFVTRDLIEDNLRAYKRLGTAIKDGRRADQLGRHRRSYTHGSSFLPCLEPYLT